MTDYQTKLIEDNFKLCYYFATDWGKKVGNKLDKEDIFSHCLLSLTKAAIHFNPDKKIKFSTYVSVIIRNEILMALRKVSRRVITIPICDLHNNKFDNEYDTWDYIQGRFTNNDNIEDWIIEETCRNAIKEVKPKQRRMIELYMNGSTELKIANITGYSQSYVSRLLKKAQKKMRFELYKHLTA
jgi:RNA polymerase sporulation-specific sigma factor